jgi:hypothetical protein
VKTIGFSVTLERAIRYADSSSVSVEVLEHAPAERPHARGRHVGPWKRAEVVDLDVGDGLDAARRREDVASRQRRYGAAERAVVPHRDRATCEDDDDHPVSRSSTQHAAAIHVEDLTGDVPGER